MSDSFELSVEISQQYEFNRDSLDQISGNIWVKNQWPLVYFLQNPHNKLVYVGESTNALERLKNHLQNPERLKLKKVTILGSEKFNKSATLDMESSLIQYLFAEGTYTLQNSNNGLVNHNYYQQDLYRRIFREVWDQLLKKKLVTKSLANIQNSALFKYSPYKSLNEDQYASVMQIMDALTYNKSNHIFISGSAGTGKTVVATYLMKLLTTDVNAFLPGEMSEEELREMSLIQAYQKRYPVLKIGLVVAMTSLRKSLKEVFRQTPGLNPGMVMSPSETTKYKGKFDLLIVDEAHRLRQYRNIGWMGAFKKVNQKLRFDDTGTELDWILTKSEHQIFFYDPAQSVKPSDIAGQDFTRIINRTNTIRLELKSQMRVLGGSNYISFVDQLLNVRRETEEKFEMESYEFLLFDSMQDLYSRLSEKEKSHGLSRLIAGYAWPWKSKADKTKYDIVLDGLKFQWNTTDKDWVNSKNAFREVGCIHTTQGYDLNYAGIIFGPEIVYKPESDRIEIRAEHYHDINGKKGIEDPDDLKAYIINIYKTLMYRGIRGTYVYACDPGLRTYFKKHLVSFKNELPFRILSGKEIKPYVNCAPLVNISVAAGNFSEPRFEDNVDLEWIELPFHLSSKEDYFVCHVNGESMNKKIPNESYCLFRKYKGGSRNGKIVLVASTHVSDPDFGQGYTVKEYHSVKKLDKEGWQHESITLKPLSTDTKFRNIILSPDPDAFQVVGIFDRVIS